MARLTALRAAFPDDRSWEQAGHREAPVEADSGNSLFDPGCVENAARGSEFATQLSGFARQACAQIMAQSAVYAAFPFLESLGLMCLEAMASGCLVVGYTGQGGMEYATTHNGHWIEDGDHENFVKALGEGLHRASGPPHPRIEAGANSARLFPRKFRNPTQGNLFGVDGNARRLAR